MSERTGELRRTHLLRHRKQVPYLDGGRDQENIISLRRIAATVSRKGPASSGHAHS
jgi:hypothetical protein